jgi:hypothetical protein
MQNQTSIIRLKNAIQSLEEEQTIKGQILREQFALTYKSLKPVNLLLGTMKDIVSSPYLTSNLVDTTIGLATGYLSKKVFVGTSVNLFRKLLGTILQFSVTNVVAKHPDAIKSFGQYLIHNLLGKNKLNSESRDK